MELREKPGLQTVQLLRNPTLVVVVQAHRVSRTILRLSQGVVPARSCS
jgi:hypothetical protein